MANLNQLFDNKITVANAILLFYLAIGNNFLKDLYPGQIIEALDKSRTAQHIIAFITMFVLITLAHGDDSLAVTTVYTIIGYFWFILTTKLDLHWNLAILLLLFLGFIYESYLAKKETRILTDESLAKEDRRRIKNKHNNARLLLAGTIFTVTLIGTFFYYNKKQAQYGGAFDYSKFIFGGPNK
jgi:Ca2+/Na+ antiporter